VDLQQHGHSKGQNRAAQIFICYKQIRANCSGFSLFGLIRTQSREKEREDMAKAAVKSKAKKKPMKKTAAKKRTTKRR
jgi:hypothetical protein